MATYYEILGVSPNATKAQIKREYLKQIAQYHPDKNPNLTIEQLQKSQELNEANSFLSDEKNRQAYDNILHLAASKYDIRLATSKVETREAIIAERDQFIKALVSDYEIRRRAYELKKEQFTNDQQETHQTAKETEEQAKKARAEEAKERARAEEAKRMEEEKRQKEQADAVRKILEAEEQESIKRAKLEEERIQKEQANKASNTSGPAIPWTKNEKKQYLDKFLSQKNKNEDFNSKESTIRRGTNTDIFMNFKESQKAVLLKDITKNDKNLKRFTNNVTTELLAALMTNNFDLKQSRTIFNHLPTKRQMAVLRKLHHYNVLSEVKKESDKNQSLDKQLFSQLKTKDQSAFLLDNELQKHDKVALFNSLSNTKNEELLQDTWKKSEYATKEIFLLAPPEKQASLMYHMITSSMFRHGRDVANSIIPSLSTEQQASFFKSLDKYETHISRQVSGELFNNLVSYKQAELLEHLTNSKTPDSVEIRNKLFNNENKSQHHLSQAQFNILNDPILSSRSLNDLFGQASAKQQEECLKQLHQTHDEIKLFKKLDFDVQSSSLSKIMDNNKKLATSLFAQVNSNQQANILITLLANANKHDNEVVQKLVLSNNLSQETIQQINGRSLMESLSNNDQRKMLITNLYTHNNIKGAAQLINQMDAKSAGSLMNDLRDLVAKNVAPHLSDAVLTQTLNHQSNKFFGKENGESVFKSLSQEKQATILATLDQKMQHKYAKLTEVKHKATEHAPNTANKHAEHVRPNNRR